MEMDFRVLMVFAIGISVTAKVLWELHLSPLGRQHIPGPKWMTISNASHYWLQFRQNRTWVFHDLFERYGPVVRIGPNRVIFRNVDAMKSIYNTHKFRKSSWYDVFTFGGTQNVFSTQDPGYHARSRRICAPAFRGETLRASSSDLLQEMEDLVGRLRRDCADGGYVDVVQLFPALALDVLGLAVLGVRFNQIASGQLSEFQKNLEYWFIDKFLVQPFPLIRLLPIPRLQKIVASDSAVTRYVMDLYDQADEKPIEEGKSILESYRAYRDAETGEPAPRKEVASDISVMFVGGTETVAVLLIHVSYYLASRKDMWDILRQEVAREDLQAKDMVETLRGLPYLNAFLRELLRANGPVNVFFERLVPVGGTTLDGYFLPEGTQVGGHAYSLHRDERVFPSPDVVDPLRWVRLDKATGRYVNREDVTPEMNSHYFPFGFGVRSCVGKVLADIELALVTAILVKNFRVNLHETTTAESMSPVELMTIRPRAAQCLFRFEYYPVTA